MKAAFFSFSSPRHEFFVVTHKNRPQNLKSLHQSSCNGIGNFCYKSFWRIVAYDDAYQPHYHSMHYLTYTFFLSKTYPSLGWSSIFINMGSLQPHDFLIIFRSISAQCLNYWHWRPITPIDWQLCLFFFSKVFRVHELFALFWICYFYFCHILMSAPFFLVCYVCCLCHSCVLLMLAKR